MTLKIISILALVFCVHAALLLEEEFDVEKAQENFYLHFCSGCQLQSNTCIKNRDFLKRLPQPYSFNTQSIVNNTEGVQKIPIYISNTTGDYSFPGVNLTNITMRSAVFLPRIDSLKGLVVYFHPTLVGKVNRPSSLSTEITAIGGLFGSQGFGVVFPDYIGFQNDSLAHPYVLYPEQNARSAVFALNQLVKQDAFGKYTNGVLKLYSLGYSQGGAYSLWFGKCLHEAQKCPYFNNSDPNYQIFLNGKYKLTRMAGLDGAYDTINVMYPFLTSDAGKFIQGNRFQIQDQYITNTGKPVLTSLILNSLLTFEYDAPNAMLASLSNGFYTMTCQKGISQELCDVKGQRYNLQTVISADARQSQIAAAIAISAVGKRNSDYSNVYLGNTLLALEEKEINSVRSLVRGTILVKVQSCAARASIVDYARNVSIPTLVFSLMQDSLVPVANAKAFAGQAQIAKNPNVYSYFLRNEDYLVCDGKQPFKVDHLRGELMASIFALNFFAKPLPQSNTHRNPLPSIQSQIFCRLFQNNCKQQKQQKVILAIIHDRNVRMRSQIILADAYIITSITRYASYLLTWAMLVTFLNVSFVVLQNVGPIATLNTPRCCFLTMRTTTYNTIIYQCFVMQWGCYCRHWP